MKLKLIIDVSGTSNKEKPKEKKPEKPKIPVTISQAVKENVRVEDLKNLLELTQTRYFIIIISSSSISDNCLGFLILLCSGSEMSPLSSTRNSSLRIKRSAILNQ